MLPMQARKMEGLLLRLRLSRLPQPATASSNSAILRPALRFDPYPSTPGLPCDATMPFVLRPYCRFSVQCAVSVRKECNLHWSVGLGTP